MTQTITALYDNKADAQAAQDHLIADGIPQGSIRIVPGNASSATSSTGAYDHRRDEGGFWASLKDAFMPDEDRYTYAEGLHRGGTLLIVSVEAAQVGAVTDTLERQGAVNIDEREATWRQSGWSGYTGAAGSASAASSTSVTSGATVSASTGSAVSETETIPVVEEQLAVGKRMTEGGSVRVRSYVRETPVQEQVTLRDETVQVERRPVDRAATPDDEALFAEKTLEATTHREQAVVSKEARVVEEIGLRKEASDRTETVSDTVRRTEVEVEDERGNVSGTGTTGTAPRKPA